MVDRKPKNKITTLFAKIIVNENDVIPRFSILYLDPYDKKFHIGFSSNNLKSVIYWLHENFKIVQNGRFNDFSALVNTNIWEYLCNTYFEKSENDTTTNFDKYKDELAKIAIDGGHCCVINGEPFACDLRNCKVCDLGHDESECIESMQKWAKQAYNS